MDTSAGLAMAKSLMRRSRAWPHCMVDKAATGKVLEFNLL